MSISESAFSQMISGYNVEYYYPASFQPEGTAKDVMSAHLCDLVAPEGVEGDTIREKIRATYAFADQAFQRVRLLSRRSGDDFITHPLAVATLLAEAGVIDLDIIQAAILHDTTEDTDVTREQIVEFIDSLEIEPSNQRGQKIDVLVEAVSKVKTLSKRHSRRTLVSVKDEMQTLTMAKIFESLTTDYRALFIKLADVVHNNLTLRHMWPEIQAEKARLSFEYFAPLARELGAYGFARTIEDTAFDAVAGGYEIVGKPNKGPAIIIRDTRDQIVTEEFIKQVAANTRDWERSIKDYDKDPVIANQYMSQYPPNPLYCSINLDTPGIYEIFKKMSKTKVLTPQDYLPTVKIITYDAEQMHQWFDILTKKYGLTNGEKTTNPWNEYFEKGEPVIKFVPVRVDNQQFLMKVELSTKEMNIMPIHLLTSINDLTAKEREIAESKLELIRNDYQQAVLTNASPAERLRSVQQGLGEGGKVKVYDRDRVNYSVPKGATYLDVAYTIGLNLGNTAESVRVANGSNEPIPKNLTDLVQPGDICSFVAPRRKNSRETVLPSRFDMVITPKAIREINAALINRKNENAVSEDAQKRGSRILQWLYEKRRGKKADILFSHVFDQDQILADRYKSLETFKRAVGFINHPSQQDRFYDLWQNEAHSSPVVEDAIRLTDKLIELRQSIWGVRINIRDQKGLLSSISDFVATKGGSIFPMRMGADEEKDQAQIEIMLIKGDEALVDQLIARIKKKYKKDNPTITKIDPENYKRVLRTKNGSK